MWWKEFSCLAERLSCKRTVWPLSGTKCAGTQELGKLILGKITWRNPFSGPQKICTKVLTAFLSCWHQVAMFLPLRTRWAIHGVRQTRKYSATFRKKWVRSICSSMGRPQKRCQERRVRARKRTLKYFCHLQEHMHHTLSKDTNTYEWPDCELEGVWTRMSDNVDQMRSIRVKDGGW